MTENINILKIDNVFVIVKGGGSDFFATSTDSIIIPAFNFSALLNFMLFRGLLSPKVLEGVLSEYYNRES